MCRLACLCTFILYCVQVLESKRELPSFIKVCHRNDPERKQCLKSSIEALQPHLGKGIPAMRIAPLDPLRISTLDISQNNINLVYTDYDIYAMNKFTVKDFDADFDKCVIFANIHYDELVSKGSYTMNGHLLLFQLEGEGKVSINFTSVELSMKLYCEKVTKRNKEYAEFTNIDMKLTADDFRLDLTNLFKDNPEATKNTIEVFNQNSKSLLEEFQDPVNKAMGAVVLQTVQNVFTSFPLDVLSPP